MKRGKIRKVRKKRGIMGMTQPEEAVLPNISSKRLQLHQKIRSTNTAGAGAATATAVAVPNTPSMSICHATSKHAPIVHC